jgi:hypothetical protein
MTAILERIKQSMTTTKPDTTEIVSRQIVEDRVSSKFGGERIVSARELWQSNLIDWIGSYKALLKYVSSDYRDIFNPRTTGENSGTRYYVPVDNIVEFLYKFENNQL